MSGIEISVQIRWEYGVDPVHLRYVIGSDQARELRIGPPPPDFDAFAMSDWMMRRQRAEGLAQHIASDVAHKVVGVFSDPRFSGLLTAAKRDGGGSDGGRSA